MHTIRLRGPWQMALATPGDGQAETIHLPVSIGDLKPEMGRSLKFSRRFHRPSELDSTAKVRIVIESPGEVLDVTLNERSLEPDEAQQYFAGDLLADRNLLTVELRLPPIDDASADRSVLDVRLEIEE
jgi:hypothetical protein